MIKDKTEIVIPTIHLRKSREIPIIIAIIFIGLFIGQCNSTKDFRTQNKELKSTNKKLLVDYTEIKEKIAIDSLYMIKSQITIDSLIQSDEKHIRQLYNVNKKYEKLKIDYNSATSDDKWDIFTRAIDN